MQTVGEIADSLKEQATYLEAEVREKKRALAEINRLRQDICHTSLPRTAAVDRLKQWPAIAEQLEQLGERWQAESCLSC